MAWETRNGQGSYYTRIRRVGNGYVREYLGKGPDAQQAALVDHQRRQAHQGQRQTWKAHWQQRQTAAKVLKDFCQATDELLRAILEQHGYHQHARGAWRKKRHAGQNVVRRPRSVS